MPGRCPRRRPARATARHPVLRAHIPTVLHGSVAGAAAPALTASGRGAAAREPRPCSVGPRSSRPAFPRLPGVPALVKTFPCRAESGKAPPCMRWRGLARPRRTRPASWLAGAARRPPVPGTRARGRSPGSSHVPGVAPGWCPFPTVKAFLLPPRTPRKALRSIISGHFGYPRGIHRTRAVIRIWRRLSTGLFTARPQLPV